MQNLKSTQAKEQKLRSLEISSLFPYIFLKFQRLIVVYHLKLETWCFATT